MRATPRAASPLLGPSPTPAICQCSLRALASCLICLLNYRCTTDSGHLAFPSQRSRIGLHFPRTRFFGLRRAGAKQALGVTVGDSGSRDSWGAVGKAPDHHAALISRQKQEGSQLPPAALPGIRLFPPFRECTGAQPSRQHFKCRRGEGGVPGPFVPRIAADRSPRQSLRIPRQLRGQRLRTELGV